MSPARKTPESTLVEFGEILPGAVDENHYKRMVPSYALTSPAIEQALAVVEDLQDRASTMEQRRHAAIEVGDSDGLLAVLRDEQSLPLELHAARIRLADIRAKHLFAEAARTDSEASSALTGPAQWILRFQDAMLLEAARVREACGAATGVSEYLRREGNEADSEARRLRRLDPSKPSVRQVGVLQVEPTARPDAGPSQSIWKITTNGAGDIIAINDRALVQPDQDGRDKREDGWRLRIDGVLIDENDQPVADKTGKIRRFASAIRR